MEETSRLIKITLKWNIATNFFLGGGGGGERKDANHPNYFIQLSSVKPLIPKKIKKFSLFLALSDFNNPLNV